MAGAITRYIKVSQVCSGKDDPPPVYMLEELASTARSNAEEAQNIAAAFLKKLDDKNPVVKWKALKSIKYVCQKGAINFQKACSRNATPIRALQNFSGPVDPLKGDALNKRVREAAQEAIQAVFATYSSDSASHLQSRIQGAGGHGSSSYSSGSGSGGFRTSSSGHGPGGVPRAISSEDYRSGLYSGGYQSGQYGQAASYGASSGGYQGSFGAAADAQPLPEALPAGVEKTEAELVDELCAPTGVRLFPSRALLSNFVDSVADLDGATVAQHLEAKLKRENAGVCLRALSGLDAVLEKGSSQACAELALHFSHQPDIVRRCLHMNANGLPALARKVLAKLGHPAAPAPGAVAATQPPQAAAAAPAADLLDLGTDAPAVPAPAGASAAGGADLLMGLVGDTAPAPASAPAPAPAAAPQPAAAAAPQLADMFGGLSVTAADAAPSAATQPYAGASLFDGLSAGEPASSCSASVSTSAPTTGSAPLDMLFASEPPAAANGTANGTAGARMPAAAPPQPAAAVPAAHAPVQPPLGAAGGGGMMPWQAGRGAPTPAGVVPPGYAFAAAGMPGPAAMPPAAAWRAAAGPPMYHPAYAMHAPPGAWHPAMQHGGAAPAMMPQGYYHPPPMPGMVHGAPAAGESNHTGTRSEVPLAAFMGSAHTAPQGHKGKSLPNFDFIGDHIKTMKSGK